MLILGLENEMYMCVRVCVRCKQRPLGFGRGLLQLKPSHFLPHYPFSDYCID